MLSERERRVLARIERHLVETDPDLARLFEGVARPPLAAVPRALLMTGLVAMLLGTVTGLAPLAMVGMAVSLVMLVAVQAPRGNVRRSGFA